MPAAKFTTKLIVTQTSKLHTGKTSTGTDYQIYQIIATKPDGTPISQSLNLRSFEDLPKGVVIEVDAELFTSERYGSSYTLKQKGGGGGGLAQAVKELATRVEHIENFLRGRGELGGTAQTPPAQAQQQAAPPPPPPPAPPPPPDPGPPTGGLPSDDIPF